MNIHYHKNFFKNYRARILPNHKLVSKFHQRLKLLIKDKTNPVLKDHALIGKKSEYRAFSITGDFRVIYKQVGDGILLYDIGTHNQVY